MNISDVGNPILSHTRARMMRDSMYVYVNVVIVDNFCLLFSVARERFPRLSFRMGGKCELKRGCFRRREDQDVAES